MGKDNDDFVVICSVKCSDLPVAKVPSWRMRCDTCDAWVWISRDLAQEVAATGYNDVHARCLECGEDVPAGDLTVGQFHCLRERGMTDEGIVMMLAVAASSKRMQPEQVLESIVDEPDGELAERFRLALRDAVRTVRGFSGRN